jgi:hypothetical protein
MMLRCECDNSRTLGSGQIITKNSYGIGVLGGGRGKGGINFLGRGRLNYQQSDAQVPRRAWRLLG